MTEKQNQYRYELNFIIEMNITVLIFNLFTYYLLWL